MEPSWAPHNGEFSCAAESQARSEPQRRHSFEPVDSLRRQLQRHVRRHVFPERPCPVPPSLGAVRPAFCRHSDCQLEALAVGNPMCRPCRPSAERNRRCTSWGAPRAPCLIRSSSSKRRRRSRALTDERCCRSTSPARRWRMPFSVSYPSAGPLFGSTEERAPTVARAGTALPRTAGRG